MMKKISMTTDEDYLRIPAKARTSTLNPSLGMVGVIVTDKTGTLTQNVMTLRTITAGINTYGSLPGSTPSSSTPTASHPHVTKIGESTSSISISDSTPKPLSISAASLSSEAANAMFYPDPKFGFSDPSLLEALKNPYHPQHIQTTNAVMTLALCHGVQVTITDDNPENTNPNASIKKDPSILKNKQDVLSIEYQSASPDEVALVQAARALGYVLLARDETSITLQILDQPTPIRYEILAVNEFNSTRKRMSILLKSPIDGSIFLLTKGADSSMIPRITNAAPTVEDSTNTNGGSLVMGDSLLDIPANPNNRRSSTGLAPGDPLGGIAVPGSRYNVVEGALLQLPMNQIYKVVVIIIAVHHLLVLIHHYRLHLVQKMVQPIFVRMNSMH